MTTQNKHTPGPWKIERGNCDYYIRRAGGPGDIAQVLDCSAAGESTVANASLIAAAPELLEALKAIYASLEKTSDTWKMQITVRDMADARAAIVKAESAG